MRFGAVETPLRQLVAQVACVDAGRGGRSATAAPAPAAPAGERAAGTRPAPPSVASLLAVAGKWPRPAREPRFGPGLLLSGKQARGEVVCG